MPEKWYHTCFFSTVTPVNPPKMKSVAKLDISSGWENERGKSQ